MLKKSWFNLVLLASSACSPHLYSEPGDQDVGPWQAPSNSWPSAAPPDALVGEGFEPGNVSLDVRGMDQLGAEVSSWQFSGLTVLVDISTMWCAPCQELGTHAEDVYQTYRDRGFMHLTVLHEDVENGDVDQNELNQWASLPGTADGEYDVITAPVIADNKGKSGSIQAVKANQYPVVLLIGPDLRVLERVEPPVTEDVIEALLEEHL